MKFRKNKKGFTIIELVIVVAVIGILAAVLIPTFINLKNEADRAAQQSNLYNANLTLRMHDANKSMSEAVNLLKDSGYDTEGLFGKEVEDPVLYHLNENQFVRESAIPSGANKYEYWKMQSTFTGSEQYSVYAMRDFKIVDQFDSNKEADEQEYTINNLKVGFDVGENLTIKSINYDRHLESSKITAVLVTNSTTYEEEQANLTINAYVNGDDCDTIYHYGKAGYVHVINSGNHSFHTGARVGAAVVDNGRFVAGQGAKVSRAVATSADATFAKEADGQYVEPPYATTEAIKNTYNADTSKGDKVDLQYDSTKGATAAQVLNTLVNEGVEDVSPRQYVEHDDPDDSEYSYTTYNTANIGSWNNMIMMGQRNIKFTSSVTINNPDGALAVLGGVLNFNLNGNTFSVPGESDPMWLNNGTWNIYGKGTIAMSDAYGATGCFLITGGNLNIYNGRFDDNSNQKLFGIDGGTVTIHSGTFYGLIGVNGGSLIIESGIFRNSGFTVESIAQYVADGSIITQVDDAIVVIR